MRARHAPCTGGVCRCDVCGMDMEVLDGRMFVVHACRADPPPAMPSLAQRAATFTQAAARHVAAGMPRASDEEIERRFAICQGCEYYDGSACRKCGCCVSRERRFLSKLAWAGEQCPVGKWGPVSVLTHIEPMAGSGSGG